MDMYDVITRKKLGEELSKDEIDFFIKEYVKGDIPDYQMSALLMAIFFKGMSYRETADLTAAMAASGEQIDLTAIKGIKVDKHSTGGVGDKTTLVVAPIVAACGLPVAKMSGRGLGHTGGTIDKLEAIKGYNSELTTEQFVKQVNDYKLAIVGQTGNLAPADKKLYALRDVTSTVDSIPLIASSIMSKKIAAGADAIVLDVKVGNGAFMKSLAEAEELANCMVSIGEALNRRTIAVISDMEQPLGSAIGNANEVLEAIRVLQGNGPEDLLELSKVLAAQMLIVGEKTSSTVDAYKLIDNAINTGEALDTFYKFLEMQGANINDIDNLEQVISNNTERFKICALATGYISELAAEQIGRATMLLGAGRAVKDANINPFVGVIFHKKAGDYVKTGDTICEVRYSEEIQLQSVVSVINNAIKITKNVVQSQKLIHKIITKK
ncbi:pyrimidine-nucleoside phosphorylase [Desulfuribacillus alkaliarsenatis]|uniref:Pyrimidine-nucleoside phosphorylase n=1 Tax=Desulfuribacillus alkaliarsenatis TaxID=766136 RepID=A0A1E5G5M8_9FIRM|nr:pyrimidine-nucleoside phosphorylase [Desulfuribacillus alkaliarsenatis]OEF98476.1 pyrimidine-nucleoside phosphorylase [Desulfuribacillus alkaliarsenatis]